MDHTPIVNMDLHVFVSKGLTVSCARNVFLTTLEKDLPFCELEIIYSAASRYVEKELNFESMILPVESNS